MLNTFSVLSFGHSPLKIIHTFKHLAVFQTAENTSLLNAFCLVFIIIYKMYYDTFFTWDCKFVWVSPMELSQLNHCDAFFRHLYMLNIFWYFHEANNSCHTMFWFTKALVGFYWYLLAHPNTDIPIWAKSTLSITSAVALSLHVLGSFVLFYCFPIPGFLAVLFYRHQPNKPDCHLAILWKYSSSPQACISAMNDKRKPWLVLVTNLLFNFLFHPLLPLALFFFFIIYPARSVYGVVMRLMRNRFPLLPGSLIWRPCIPAALQSRYKYGSWCRSWCLFKLIENYYLFVLSCFVFLSSLIKNFY